MSVEPTKAEHVKKARQDRRHTCHDGPHTCEHEGGPPWVETRPWPAFHNEELTT